MEVGNDETKDRSGAHGEGGYTVTIPSLPGCISEGNTKKEALKSIKEAILLYMEPVEDDLNYSPDSEIVEISL